MKKENLKFNPSDFQYDPIQQPKRPLWMTSVESYKTSKTTIKEMLAFIGVIGSLFVLFLIFR